MRAEKVKQLLKNGVYRTIGETAAAIGANENGNRSLRVLMYHKVNDLPENPLTMPVSVFDEQMDQLRGLGYTVVDLQAVLAHYVDGIPLPPKAVLITFDDGYHDNLANAAEVLKRYGYPAVLFVPIGYLDDRQPLPHEERLAAQGILNRTIDWEEMADLERAGIRIESHGISHRPLADLELDEAAREIALSKLRLEEKLDRPVRAFSAVSGSNSPRTDPLQLRRYNIEPYSPRTFELVLAGACDLISVKDTVTGTHARRLFNAALGTSTK